MTKKKRLLFVWSAAEFSTYDVARGYHGAFLRDGRYDVRDYRLSARMRYHAKALGDKAVDLDLLARCACENIVIEAMRHRVDLVFIVSGLALHPDAVWYLARVGIPTVTLFTESPYDDKEQREFHAVYPDMKCFTMERTSAHDGWTYLPHAYDPAIHYPVKREQTHDVLMIGTLWPERIKLLSAVNWNGYKPRLFGTWIAPPTPEHSPIGQFYTEGCIPNEAAPAHYCASKICLNIFRKDAAAESLNPRAFELAACRAFQLTDYRVELDLVFGEDVVPTFEQDNAESLEKQVHYWLTHDEERRERAEVAYQAVLPHTFDARLRSMLSSL